MPAQVLSNLESLGDMIGSLQGIADGLNEDKYMEGLIQDAHGEAANMFDVAAASTAKAGYLAHAFEFGNPGITPGQGRFADPTEPAARLWVHRIASHGGNAEIYYSFRPALQPNPKPTATNTGVPRKYLDMLSQRKYVFWNKAFVMETGTTVNIKSERNNGFVFVPFYGEPSKDPTNHRGYMMWDSTRLGPIRTVPGRDTRGQFTAFWMGWWANAGQQTMDLHMRAKVSQDIETAAAEAGKRANAHKLETPASTNIVSTASRARSMAEKLFGIKTKAHRKDVVI